MTYEGAINNALDKDIADELDDTLAHKSEDELTDDERKYLKRKREKKSYTFNVRFTETEMQDILAKCEHYGYKNKTEYIRDCVRARVDLTPDRNEIAETMVEFQVGSRSLIMSTNSVISVSERKADRGHRQNIEIGIHLNDDRLSAERKCHSEPLAMTMGETTLIQRNAP